MPLLRRVLLIAALVLVLGFLVLPVVVVVPLSFSTARYLSFPPPGFGLGWYRIFFGNEAWT
ncbi:ABC transporter permease, partial [Roseomonas sp. DSM 102946]|nr:ABC transporter permease [Roseomonas sp. DSM 102946]